MQVLQTGGGNGSFFIQPVGATVVTIELNCGAPCNYTAAEVTGKTTGGNPATTVFAQALKGSPAFCGTATLSASYATTNPKPVWVTK